MNRTGAKSTAVRADYAVRTDAGDLLASGTLTFAVDQGSRTFTFTPAQNSLAEGDRTVQLMLSNPTNGATLANPSTASLAVADDESLIEFTADHYTEKKTPARPPSRSGARAGWARPARCRCRPLPGRRCPAGTSRR